MDFARQSAPTDGRDAIGNIVEANKVALTSKQNSDASGVFYQWGRKDPFLFVTSSETRLGSAWDYGKHPVKIYTIDGVLIYQDNIGGDNKNKQPSGGIITTLTYATTMMETIKNPITFYYVGNNTVVNQVGHTKSLWNYYWISYSRGTDGFDYPINNKNLHNIYLDGSLSQRLKSIFDPCPSGFRVPSNGVFNNFEKLHQKWILYNYAGGCTIKINNIDSFLPATGWHYSNVVCVGDRVMYYSGSSYSPSASYSSYIGFGGITSCFALYGASSGHSVRCIEVLSS